VFEYRVRSEWSASGERFSFCRSAIITHAGVQGRDVAKILIERLVCLFGRLRVLWADGGYWGELVQRVKELPPFDKLRWRSCAGEAHPGFSGLTKRCL